MDTPHWHATQHLHGHTILAHNSTPIRTHCIGIITLVAVHSGKDHAASTKFTEYGFCHGGSVSKRRCHQRQPHAHCSITLTDYFMPQRFSVLLFLVRLHFPLCIWLHYVDCTHTSYCISHLIPVSPQIKVCPGRHLKCFSAVAGGKCHSHCSASIAASQPAFLVIVDAV